MVFCDIRKNIVDPTEFEDICIMQPYLVGILLGFLLLTIVMPSADTWKHQIAREKRQTDRQTD